MFRPNKYPSDALIVVINTYTNMFFRLYFVRYIELFFCLQGDGLRRIGPNLRLIPTSLYLSRDGRQLLCSTAPQTGAAATVTTAVNRGSRSSILPRWGRSPRRAAAKRPAVDAAVASAGSANTAAKLPKLAVAESKDDDKVAADVNNIATTMAETRDVAVGPANPAQGEQKGQDNHREEVLEADAVDGTDIITPVFESLLTDEMEMVEETIKEDQAISSSSSIRSAVEEPADRGKGGGEVVVSEEEAKKDLVKQGGCDEGPTTAGGAAAATATAKEQRRQEKKKYSYSIPALCQGGRRL
jgi:hypothetical protein